MFHRVQKEIGSMYHWETEFPQPVWRFPEPAVLYAICRHAIVSLCAVQPSRPVLWLPSFFCPEVARSCREVATVREYHDDCRWPAPRWSTLSPGPRDLVLAVNYFGVRSSEPWSEWRKKTPCVLVEDHTQDPFSTWALHSTAEYAVCSIRKTLSVPDGAILWSPLNLALPPASTGRDWNGSALKAAAMWYKREYLAGNLSPEHKTRFRELQLEGEHLLGASSCSAISPMSEAILSSGVPHLWREQRIENARTLLGALHLENAEPAYRDWPEGHAPFTLPIVFPDQQSRDRYQRCLQAEDVYAPVEWVCDSDDRNAMDLSSRILSLPIDHRYDREDMLRIAQAIDQITASQSLTARLGR